MLRKMLPHAAAVHGSVETGCIWKVTTIIGDTPMFHWTMIDYEED